MKILKILQSYKDENDRKKRISKMYWNKSVPIEVEYLQ